jgi:hypothetical protein
MALYKKAEIAVSGGVGKKLGLTLGFEAWAGQAAGVSKLKLD